MEKRGKKLYEKIGRLIILIVSIILIVFVLVQNYNKDNNKITGETVYVSYYGVSNYPLNLEKICGSNSYCKKGVQTGVNLEKSDLDGILYGTTAIDVAGKVVNAINLGSNIVSIFKEGLKAIPGVVIPVPTSGLDIVTQASGAIISEFKKNTDCIGSVARKLSGTKPTNGKYYQFDVVSYMAYKQCAYYSNWWYAFVRHDYYTIDGKYVCTYEGSKLFSLEQGTGKLSKSTAGC